MSGEEAVDFLGRKIEIGSKVVFVQKNYRNLLHGVVIRITKCMVFIEHEKTNDGEFVTRQGHEQVIVVDLPEMVETLF